MITVAFLILVAVASSIAVRDAKRGWKAFIIVAVLQDPIRKLTPGTPVVLSYSVMGVYFSMIFGALASLKFGILDFQRRFSTLYTMVVVFLWVLLMAGFVGLMTFGFNGWAAPALGLFIYLIPLPAVMIGYCYLSREEDFLDLLGFYALVTSVMLIGVPFEYIRYPSNILGTVALGTDWIRYFPGIQVRILSGTFRSPDIMAWHAAMVSISGLFLMVRRGFPKGWLWMTVAAWGLLCAVMSGRRKMLYMIVIFAILFVLRYLTRFNAMQFLSLCVMGLAVSFLIQHLSGEQGLNVYTQGAVTTKGELFGRLEGGVIEGFEQYGVMGLGLGSVTQGVLHFNSDLQVNNQLGWQEGGAGKLAVELGLPGFLYTILFLFVIMRTLYIIAYRSGRSEMSVLRTALFGIVCANAGSFLASHQPYSDGVLVLMNAFFIGIILRIGRDDAVRDEEAMELTVTTDTAPLAGGTGDTVLAPA